MKQVCLASCPWGREQQAPAGRGPGLGLGQWWLRQWGGGGGKGLGHLLCLSSSEMRRLPEGLWERTEQELQKPVSILTHVSIKDDSKPETFLRAFPTTAG